MRDLLESSKPGLLHGWQEHVQNTVVAPVFVFQTGCAPLVLNLTLCFSVVVFMALQVRGYLAENNVLPIDIYCLGCEEVSRFGRLVFRCAKGTGKGQETCFELARKMEEWRQLKAKLAKAMKQLEGIREKFRLLMGKIRNLYGQTKAFFARFSLSSFLPRMQFAIPRVDLPSCGVDLSFFKLGRHDPCSALERGINGVMDGVESVIVSMGNFFRYLGDYTKLPFAVMIDKVKLAIKKIVNLVWSALSELKIFGQLVKDIKAFMEAMEVVDPYVVVYTSVLLPIERFLASKLGPAFASIKALLILMVLCAMALLVGVVAGNAYSGYLTFRMMLA